MSEPRPSPDSPTCDAPRPEAMEAEVVALVRGELSPAEAGPVRAHMEGCPSCVSLAGDTARIGAAAAARPAPLPDAAARARLSAVLDAAWDEEEARERARGPVLRLLDHAGRRYAESRAVRFLTFSLAAHAAAAVVLAVYLVGDGTAPPIREPIEVSTGVVLPPVYPDEPLPPPAARIPDEVDRSLFPGVDPAWPGPGSLLTGADPTPVLQDPPDLRATVSLYPTAEFSAWATGRFRSDLRSKRLARAWGEEEAGGVRRSVELGLRVLAAMQESDGTWASGQPGDHRMQRDRFRGGVTGVALSAFLGDGRTARREGSFDEVVLAGVNALLHSQDEGGFLGAFARGPANDRPLCNHGPALAALAEAYGLDYRYLTPEMRRGLASVIERGVEATLRAQRTDGSFGYAPGARGGDSSVTLLQVEALEAARLAGFEVDPAALGRASAWLMGRVGSDGRLGYRVAGDRAGDATLTAGALALGRALGMSGEVSRRMRGAALDEAAATDLGGRVLFRSSLLEVLAAEDGSAPGSRGPAAVRATLAAQSRSGTFSSRPDPWSVAAGDALSTARTVRALTAPYRTPGP